MLTLLLPRIRNLAGWKEVPSTGSWTEGPLLGGRTGVRAYLATFATEFTVLVSTLVVLRIAALYWGPTGFGEFIVARRTISFLHLPLLCGMGLAITRYVAVARQGATRRSEGAYFISGLLVALSATSMAAVVLWVGAEPLAYLFFGSPEHAAIVCSIALAVFGGVLHGLVYGLFRGRRMMGIANALQFVTSSLVPLVVFMLPGLQVAEMVALQGVLSCLVPGSMVLVLLLGLPAQSWKRTELRGAVTEVTSYGAPRVLGELTLSALLSLPVTVAAHFQGVETAGFIGVGVSLLSMVAALFAPLGHILLPSAAAWAASGDLRLLAWSTHRLASACVVACAVIVGTIEILAPILLEGYLGSAFEPAVPFVRIIVLAAVPYCLYIVLRSILDALRTRPLNTKNALISLATLALLLAAGRSAEWIAVSFAGSILVLGVLTGYDAVRLLRLPKS